MKKNILILTFIILSITPGITDDKPSDTNNKQAVAPDVLLVYSSGTPFITISKMNPESFDAVSCPTPAEENMKTVANKLAVLLRSHKLIVRIAESQEIKHPGEVLDARMVIIGSPSYFGNVSWPIKKFLDEIFGKIYASGSERLNGKRIAAFSMAEIEPSARHTLDTIKRAVGDCRGTFGPSVIVLTQHSEQEVTKRINEFAEKISSFLRN